MNTHSMLPMVSNLICDTFIILSCSIVDIHDIASRYLYGIVYHCWTGALSMGWVFVLGPGCHVSTAPTVLRRDPRLS